MELQLQHQSFHPGLISFRIDWFDLLDLFYFIIPQAINLILKIVGGRPPTDSSFV